MDTKKIKFIFKRLYLLVVLFAVSILFALTVMPHCGIPPKSYRQHTLSIIATIHVACETYKGDWFLYPDVTNPPAPIVIPGMRTIKYTGDNFGKITANNFKKIEAIKAANKRLMFILGNPHYIEGVHRESYWEHHTYYQDKDLFLDSWGQLIRIVPGRNHTKDKPANKNWFHVMRNRTPLDIYSVGEDGVDETGNSFSQTALDKEKADDVVNWNRLDYGKF